MADIAISQVTTNTTVPPPPKTKKSSTRKTKKASTSTVVDDVPSIPVTPVSTSTVVDDVSSLHLKQTQAPVVVPPVVVDVKQEVVEIASPVSTTVIPEPVVETDVVVEEKKKPTKRGVPTKEKLLQDMTLLTTKLTTILEDIPPNPSIKQFVREWARFKLDLPRVLKIRDPDKKVKDNTNSGFMKPVRVSKELETFLKNDDSFISPLTRAYLTTRLCTYIKKNNLQNPEDKRIILPDDNLKTLFAIEENDTQPLTYYNIQKRIQKHIFKLEEDVTTTTTT